MSRESNLDAEVRVLADRYGAFCLRAGLSRHGLPALQKHVLAAVVAALPDDQLDVLVEIFEQVRSEAIESYVQSVENRLDATDND